MPKLVLIRHGQSQWNLDNRFSGWADVDLTALGAEEAREAGELLKREGYAFDVAHTRLVLEHLAASGEANDPDLTDAGGAGAGGLDVNDYEVRRGRGRTCRGEH